MPDVENTECVLQFNEWKCNKEQSDLNNGEHLSIFWGLTFESPAQLDRIRIEISDVHPSTFLRYIDLNTASLQIPTRDCKSFEKIFLIDASEIIHLSDIIIFDFDLTNYFIDCPKNYSTGIDFYIPDSGQCVGNSNPVPDTEVPIKLIIREINPHTQIFTTWSDTVEVRYLQTN